MILSLVYTVNDRLNALDVYLKIQNFTGAFIRERRLIKRGVYFKMHRKQKLLVGHVPIELFRLKYVARSESGKMLRVLYDKLQEMKEKYLFNDVLRKTKLKIVNFKWI